MKNLIFFGFFAVLSASVQAEECSPEATQRLGSIMSKVTQASRTVDGYKKKYKTDSTVQSDLIVFCLSGEARPEFESLFNEAAPAVNNLEEFGNGQTGPCKDAALKASQDLERNVRQIMARFEECKRNQK